LGFDSATGRQLVATEFLLPLRVRPEEDIARVALESPEEPRMPPRLSWELTGVADDLERQDETAAFDSDALDCSRLPRPPRAKFQGELIGLRPGPRTEARTPVKGVGRTVDR
jgi:hypothetical protein